MSKSDDNLNQFTDNVRIYCLVRNYMKYKHYRIDKHHQAIIERIWIMSSIEVLKKDQQ
jgi:hypothetical protein